MAGTERAARDLSQPALRVRLRLAGLPVDLHLEGCAEAFAALAVHREPARPAGAATAPALSLHLRAFPGLPPKLDHLAFEQRGEALFCDGDGLRGEVASAWARLDVFGGQPALFAGLRLCAALWLAPRGGLLLHGACVEPAPGGRALSLLGQSGAGKSTVSRRLERAFAHVLSDEVTAVMTRSEAGGERLVTDVTDVNEVDDVRAARVHGHPFPRRLGDGLAPPAGLPLAALGFLSHAAPGAGPSVQRLSAAEAARALLLRVFLPVRSPALVAAALDSCGRLAAAAPAFALALPDDDRAAPAALSLLADLAPEARQ